MRAYYVGDALKRINKLHHGKRRVVLEHARNEALRLSSPLDLAGHLYAVFPRHLDECGFKSKKRPLTPRQQLEETFISYFKEVALSGTRANELPDKMFRKWMRMPGTNAHDAFQHFANGWSAGRASR